MATGTTIENKNKYNNVRLSIEWLEFIWIACTNATCITRFTWKYFQIDYRLFYVLIILFILSFDLSIYVF